ncbi:MAG: methyltransferase domain-containing protein [Candidatus Moraniibacteriota bacterium]|nr:MAG: methyltransferase domain-containing protein [Candidatus Moranbacteria bacterium]
MALKSQEHFELAHQHSTWRERQQHIFVEAEHRARYLFVSQFVKGKRVLDLACGEGYGADILKQAGADQVLAGDQEKPAIDKASAKYPGVTYAVMNAETFQLPPESIDVAVSFETIEHLMQPELLLAQLQQCVVPGGDVFISTPNRRVSNPGKTLQDKPANPFHIREYTPEEFQELLAKYFTIVAMYEQGIYVRTKNFFLQRAQRLFKALLVVLPGGAEVLARVRPALVSREPTYVLMHCRRRK